MADSEDDASRARAERDVSSALGTQPAGAEKAPSVLDKAKELPGLLRKPKETNVWKSVFRHKLDGTPRNRVLAVLSNVFLHLHPTRIRRDAVRYCFTWGMGGITFFLFIVLTLTGIYLMFYFHPSKVQAFRDIVYLRHEVPFGNLLR